MDAPSLIQSFAISMLLGLLVGLQRERTESDIAGFRTFPLIAAFGTLCAILAQEFDAAWILAAGILGVVGVFFVGNIPSLKEETGQGVTTEVAMLVMFAVGAFVIVGPWIVAVAVTGAVAILLQFKPQLHGLAKRIGDQDIRAILQFVLITFIILPVLPNQAYDPLVWLQPAFPNLELPSLKVLNPYEIWLMVVLVVAISLGGYVSYKLFGSKGGTLLGGVLGGTISSTATTVSYARRSATTPKIAAPAALVIVIAGTVTFVRVLLEIGVTAPQFLHVAAPPLLVMFATSVMLSGLLWIFHRHDKNEIPEQDNPTELKSAIIFAVVYAIVLLAVASGKAYLEDTGLYVVAVLSGMTDMDAITLSTANFVKEGRLEPETAWRVIVVATMSNIVFKGCLVAAIGDRSLLRKITLLFGALLLAGGLVLAFWPA